MHPVGHSDKHFDKHFDKQFDKDVPMVEKQSNLIKISTPSPTVNKLSVMPDKMSIDIVHCIPSAALTGPVGANGNNSAPTITTMESGGIKITYDKQQPPPNAKTSQIQSQEDLSGRASR